MEIILWKNVLLFERFITEYFPPSSVVQFGQNIHKDESRSLVGKSVGNEPNCCGVGFLGGQGGGRYEEGAHPVLNTALEGMWGGVAFQYRRKVKESW